MPDSPSPDPTRRNEHSRRAILDAAIALISTSATNGPRSRRSPNALDIAFRGLDPTPAE